MAAAFGFRRISHTQAKHTNELVSMITTRRREKPSPNQMVFIRPFALGIFWMNDVGMLVREQQGVSVF